MLVVCTGLTVLARLYLDETAWEGSQEIYQPLCNRASVLISYQLFNEEGNRNIKQKRQRNALSRCCFFGFSRFSFISTSDCYKINIKTVLVSLISLAAERRSQAPVIINPRLDAVVFLKKTTQLSLWKTAEVTDNNIYCRNKYY